MRTFEELKKIMNEIDSITVSRIASRNTDYKFTWNGTTYSTNNSSPRFDVCKIIIKKKGDTQKYELLYFFDFLYCIGSFKPHAERFVMDNMPTTNSEEINSWCEKQKEHVLKCCKIVE